MLLSKILENVKTKNSFNDGEISDLVYDSRKAKDGTLFVCLVGAKTDGHNFAEGAYKNGCRAFLAERELDLPPDAKVILVDDTRAALARCSCSFFKNPADELTVIGITGTKGKTSIAHIVQKVLSEAGEKCGIIGTVGAGYDDVKLPTVNTTPESYEIQKLFRAMIDGGCKAVALEVSSLGLKSHRVDGIFFDYAVCHKHHFIRYILCKSHLMSDNYHRDSLICHLFNHSQNLSHKLRIQCRCRLIKQNHIRI